MDFCQIKLEPERFLLNPQLINYKFQLRKPFAYRSFVWNLPSTIEERRDGAAHHAHRARADDGGLEIDVGGGGRSCHVSSLTHAFAFVGVNINLELIVVTIHVVGSNAAAVWWNRGRWESRRRRRRTRGLASPSPPYSGTPRPRCGPRSSKSKW